MARKKKTQSDNAASHASSQPSPAASMWYSQTKPKATEPSTSALIICRNKHWRYISSFHGPWLQLPPEVLESLAHSNYIAPRPHPIDPAVFYDLVKIRKAVDEATNLAVRAASGVTSAQLNASMTASNGMLNSAGASALGLGFGGMGGSKLSAERKHRMRELATQKLSQAYHLDEIAASVATMQSASTLENIAELVLRRNPLDYDAIYVHFFHEKIPSRMLAQCTPLAPLDHLLNERPNDGPPFRTRALTRIFKKDYVEAAKDLTEGLGVARWLLSQHRAGKDQLVLAKTLREEAQQRSTKDWKSEHKIEEEDQPSSLESQLLFHRANVHFTIATQHVNSALDAYQEEQEAREYAASTCTSNGTANGTSTQDGRPSTPKSQEEREAHRRHLEFRKLVKTNAKKALRDYNAFLSHFDYTPGLRPDIAESFLRRINEAAKEQSKIHKVQDSARKYQSGTVVSEPSSPTEEMPLDATTGALVLPPKIHRPLDDMMNNGWPSLPPVEIFPASALFSEKVPDSIPAYPSASNALTTRSGPTSQQTNSSAAAAAAFADSHEAVTYHPLLTDALHSLLLCHALLQTSPTELKRHAHNAARLARICDGYPIFLAARSPARADWVEVLRRANNWIGLTSSWEALCRPAPLPGHSTQGLGDRGWNLGGEPDTPIATTSEPPKPQAETQKQKAERRKHEAILDALADERVVDEESFQRAVRARERRAIEDEVAELEALELDANGTEFEENSERKPIEDGGEVKAVEEKEAIDGAQTDEETISVAAEPKTSTWKQPPPEPTIEPTTPTQPATEPETPTTTTNGTSKPPPQQQRSKPKRKPTKPFASPAEDDDKDYPISTDRAEAIARWVREAPVSIEGASKGKKGAKKGMKKNREGDGDGDGDVEAGVGVGAEREVVEEEVD
ncbi:hypothetical protein FKW77_002232 [Venturia effusa]|uniref:Uncharacterized protein n=1 Tax=Venturia effusa TaxID=50376 RepID=A0A517LAG9_9PEZI|nr:hypothetical protein FKW77_002232 [Venturia effusa]